METYKSKDNIKYSNIKTHVKAVSSECDLLGKQTPSNHYFEIDDINFDKSFIISSLDGLNSEIVEIKLMSISNILMMIQKNKNVSMINSEALMRIMKLIEPEETCEKSLFFFGILTYISDRFNQFFYRNDTFFSIINSNFSLMEYEAKQHIFTILANLFHDDDNFPIEETNIVPLILNVSNENYSTEYFRLISLMISLRSISSQTFTKLLKLLMKTLTLENKINTDIIIYSLFGIKNSIQYHEAQVIIGIQSNQKIVDFLLNLLTTKIKIIIIQTLELLDKLLCSSIDFYSIMINFDFPKIARNLITFADQEIVET